jgi:hypothetical protein
MYSADVIVEGTSPLLQHRFGIEAQNQLEQPSKRSSGHTDYSQEWKDSLYEVNGCLAQPGIHFEMAMVKAALSFKLPGKRGKTYKDLFSANVFVRPELPLHLDKDGREIQIPDQLETNAYESSIYIDYRSVVVNRGSRVGRARLAFSPGWRIRFSILVQDPQLPAEVVNQVLTEAGQAVGIGDYRPRYGRFKILRFDISQL